MRVNGVEYNVDALLKSVDFVSYHMEKCGSLFLTKDEISTLQRYHVDYKSALNFNGLRIMIEEVLDEVYDEEMSDLESVLMTISERNYYQNTRK